MYPESTDFNEFDKPLEKVEYAGFWLRAVAMLIDLLILSIPTLILSIMFGIRNALSGYYFDHFSTSENQAFTDPARYKTNQIIVQVLLLLIQFAYCTILESSVTQGTVGKMVIRLRITDLNYKRISFGRASGRFVAKNLYGIGITLLFLFSEPVTSSSIRLILSFFAFISYCLAGWTYSKQALHDMIVGTYVIKKNPHEVIREAVPNEGY